MLPDWFTKPESLFRFALWLFGPFFAWAVGRIIIRRAESWYASRSESTAKARLTYFYKALAEPPTLLESLAWIICFLPLPFAIASLLLYMHFAPPSPTYTPPIDARLAQKIGEGLLTVLFFFTYLLFSILAIHGIRVAYRLRDGQARYHEHYRAGIQKQIDKLKKKFPQLPSASA